MTKQFKIGQRVIVNGEHDDEVFADERGVIVKKPDWMGNQWVAVRFDKHREAFHDGGGDDDGHHWFFDQRETGYAISPAPCSTYLNGETTLGDILDAAMKAREAASARPRFMTMWMTDSDQPFTPTGDAFLTLEDAEAFARSRLTSGIDDDQIAVFEIRSVHLARRVISSEAA